ncbi:MAG: ABC transporter ATP-binding protein [Hungatella sp.]|nr:ABC transporter ATP-binding protein [Hungatella sp.]
MFSYLIGTLDIKEKRTLIVYSILSVLTPVVDLFSISMMLPVMNQLVGAAHVSKDFVVLVLGMNILIILKGIFELYKSKILNVLLYDGAYHLSVRLYELLMKEDLLKHNHREAMQAITMIRGDSVACMRLLINGIDIISACLTVAGFFAVLVAVAKGIGIIGCCGFLLCVAFVYFFNRRNMKVYGEERRKCEIRLNAQITVSYGMFKIFKLDACWKSAMRRFEKYGKKYAQMQEKFLYRNTTVSVFLNNIVQAVFFLGMLSGVMLEINLTSVFAEAIVFVTLLVRMLPIGSSIVKSMHSVEFEKRACESLRKNMEEYERIKGREGICEKQREKKVTLSEGLKIRNLTFFYREGINIFTDMSVDIPAGKSTAVIGASGVGKTTFLDLVLGLLVPQQGNIYYDDYDIVTETDSQGKCKGMLGEIVSYIPQTIYLNGETIRNNVAFFADEIDDEKVCQSLAVARVLEDVEQLPEGIYSLIGEHGAAVSGGQRQRIALARALYKDFELLVMDEAMAALDMDTEKAVIDSIRAVKTNKTILLVTHHMNLANECDFIYKIENQKMVRVK